MEERVVPTVVIGPLSGGEKGFVTATIQEVGNQIQATFTLAPDAPPNYTTPVGLALYSLISPGTNPNTGPYQVRVQNVGSYPLSAAHPTETITVVEPLSGGNLSCLQGDAYYGPATTAPMELTAGPNDYLNSHLLAALVDCPDHHGPNTGLTIGYYKNHLGAFGLVGLDPNQTVASVFGAYGDFAPGSPYYALGQVSLADALSLGGGPSLSNKAGLLIKQAVGALLNASIAQINYAISAYDVVLGVHNALAAGAAGNPNALTNFAGVLDAYNSAEGVDLGLPNTNAGGKNK